MKLKTIVTSTIIAAYTILPAYAIISDNSYERATEEASIVADTNHNGTLSLTEIQDAYKKMGINPDAINKKPFDRLRNDDIRFPMRSDLEKLTK